MDRGHHKGLRLQPDRRSRGTWLGLLIGSWLLLAMLAWFDPFHIGRHRFEQPLRDPRILLVTPERGPERPRGITLSADGFGKLFVFGNIDNAPIRYGTQAQLEAAGTGRWDGPWSLTEAWSREARGEANLGHVGDVVRVVALADRGFGHDRVTTVDIAGSGPNWSGPKAGKLVLANGCLRFGSAAGPLVVLADAAKGLFVDNEGWLTVGGFGANQLRVGEPGELSLELPIADAAALRALRLQCGGNAQVVQLSSLYRKPVCDLTRAQAAANRAALSEQQRAMQDRMTAQRESMIAACVARGQDRTSCARTIPPMPPPPTPPGGSDWPGAVYHGMGPGDSCVAQEDLPTGAWTAPRPQANR